jgi:antitoxin (DNA-binding transcriptional repressor) of toxin-antitoxin stability system
MPAATDLPPALSALSTINGTKVRADPDFPTDIKRLCANLSVSVNRVKRGRSISIGTWGVICAVIVTVATVFGLQKWWPTSKGTAKKNDTEHSLHETVGPEGFPSTRETESATFAKEHPAFIVYGDEPANYQSTIWSLEFSRNKSNIEAGCRSTGRIDLPNHPTITWAGTGWVLEKDSVVVPKYVLEAFAREDESGWRFEHEALIDFGKYGSEYHAYRIESVKYVSSIDNSGALAVLGVPTLDSKFHVPLIVETEKTAAVRKGRKVFIVGFPANDMGIWISPEIQNAVLQGVYDVKRVMPGALTGQRYGDKDWLVRHDCFTTAGTGGAPLFDLGTGKVIGVQVARDSPDYAYGVGVWILDEYLK